MKEKSLRIMLLQFKIEIKRILESQDSKEIYDELSRIFTYLSAMEATLKATEQEVPLELTHLLVTIEMLEELYRP